MLRGSSPPERWTHLDELRACLFEDHRILGCGHVKVAEGIVIVQNPATAVSPQMPQNVISLGLAHHVVDADKIPGELARRL